MYDKREYYDWQVEYRDGTIIPRYKDDGSATKWEEIDFTKIKHFSLVPRDSNKNKLFVLDFNGTQRPIFWKHVIGIDFLNDAKEFICYKFGFQTTIYDINHKVINFIYPTGDIETYINKNEPVMYNFFVKQLELMVKNNGMDSNPNGSKDDRS